MLKLLIDCDTGIDDSIAILFALKRPDVRVVGITTGFGNTSVSQATENTLRLVQLANAHYAVPVAMGADKPLLGDWSGPAECVHGGNGIGNVILPPSNQAVVSESACDMIVRLARENPGEITLVTLGRMTNLALALEKEPNLPKLFAEVVAMGGTVFSPGNVTPVCEANIAGDPEAADRVFMAGFRLTLVGLDVTTKTRLTGRHLEMLNKYCVPENRAVVDYILSSMKCYFNFSRVNDGNLEHCPVHDPLAVLAVVDPSLMIIRKMRARVECGGTMCRGMVVADLRANPMDAPYTSVCIDVKAEQAVEELIAAFTAPCK